MKDEDRDIDVESDEDDDDLGPAGQYMTQAEKRAHHNALERKRRDHIKESFNILSDAIPSLQGSKASRAQIVKTATEYIQFMSKKNGSIAADIDDLKKQNSLLDQQVRALEKAKRAGSFVASNNLLDHNDHSDNDFKEDTDTDSENDYFEPQQRKKLKT